MSATIKRFDRECDEFSMVLAEEGSFVLHADHLASHAYDEEKERALFEAELVAAGVACTRRTFGDEAEDQGLMDGDYYGMEARDGWRYWKACAKSRAKAAGCE
jgi:hypothetical protein